MAFILLPEISPLLLLAGLTDPQRCWRPFGDICRGEG